LLARQRSALAMFGIPLEFVIFGIVLIAISIYQRFALPVAAAGLAVLVLFRLAAGGQGTAGNARLVAAHFAGNWVSLANLFLLLLGFAVLSNQFERSQLPEAMPRWLPKPSTSHCPARGDSPARNIPSRAL